jgi:hypothetical protein
LQPQRADTFKSSPDPQFDSENARRRWFLKGGSRAISLADYNVEKRLVLAVAHRMLLGDDEAAPISGDDASVPQLRCLLRDCPF